MALLKLTDAETKLADLIWDNEPINSGDLVKLGRSSHDWKKSTTYTLLKRLIEKKIFINQEGFVSSLIKKEDYYAKQGELLVDEIFEGSLPKFLAAFTNLKKLSQEEIEDIQELIDNFKES